MATQQIIYGLTGGIGSGKTYVAQLLHTHFNLPVYDTDSVAKDLINTSRPLQQQLKQLVGQDIMGADGQVNKAVVAAYLFANEQHAANVNALVHPHVFDHFQAWCRQQQGHVVAESAILFESGMHKLVNHIIVVTAPLALRQQRVQQRDGLTPQQFQQRLSRQLPEDELLARAHTIIHNDGRPLLPQIQNIFQ